MPRQAGGRAFGTLVEADYADMCRHIKQNSITHTCVTARTKNGDELVTTREKWNALPLSERLRYESWVSYPSPDDAAKLAASLREAYARQMEQVTRAVTPDAFVGGQNRAYMARAQNPQPSMTRVSQQAAMQMLANGTDIYRLLPGGAEKLDPIKARRMGLLYAEYREFAVRSSDKAAIDQWAARQTAAYIGRLEQARQAVPKQKHGMEL